MRKIWRDELEVLNGPTSFINMFGDKMTIICTELGDFHAEWSDKVLVLPASEAKELLNIGFSYACRNERPK